jgi:hypothetical protein
MKTLRIPLVIVLIVVAGRGFDANAQTERLRRQCCHDAHHPGPTHPKILLLFRRFRLFFSYMQWKMPQ